MCVLRHKDQCHSNHKATRMYKEDVCADMLHVTMDATHTRRRNVRVKTSHVERACQQFANTVERTTNSNWNTLKKRRTWKVESAMRCEKNTRKRLQASESAKKRPVNQNKTRVNTKKMECEALRANRAARSVKRKVRGAGSQGMKQYIPYAAAYWKTNTSPKQ